MKIRNKKYFLLRIFFLLDQIYDILKKYLDGGRALCHLECLSAGGGTI